MFDDVESGESPDVEDVADGDIGETPSIASNDQWTAIEVPQQLVGERIDKTVSLLLDLPRTQLVTAMKAGLIRVNGRPTYVKPSYKIEADVEITHLLGDFFVTQAPQAEPSVDVDVVYEDDAVIVVNKPAGLVVHPGAGTKDGTLVNGLLARYPELAAVGEPVRPGIVHRIDKGTSGLLMVARTEAARLNLIEQLSSHHAKRTYVSIVWGHVEAAEGVIDAPIGRSERNPLIFTVNPSGKWARTHYKVTQRFERPAPMTMLELQLETGRTHQIRVHCAAIGHSVVGDAQYRGARGTFVIPRPFLHAASLGFDHPVSGEPVVFDAPLPSDLEAVFSALE
jgi:23S rRNA pseudouridine1911/1915/1917 synthase